MPRQPAPPMPSTCWKPVPPDMRWRPGMVPYHGSPCVASEPPPPPEPRLHAVLHDSRPPPPPPPGFWPGPKPAWPLNERAVEIGLPLPPWPPPQTPMPPADGKFAEFSVLTRTPSPPRTVTRPLTMKSPLTSHTIGRVPWPFSVTPLLIVTLRKLNTPPDTLNGNPFAGTICVKSVLSTTSGVVGL